ncbi:MAG: PKD domain-containing protein [Candidatus Magasanikbacteria bacterium]|nr:PKD domain-containing protein [Candidatus Magasanikbacteria bacterium]
MPIAESKTLTEGQFLEEPSVKELYGIVQKKDYKLVSAIQSTYFSEIESVAGIFFSEKDKKVGYLTKFNSPNINLYQKPVFIGVDGKYIFLLTEKGTIEIKDGKISTGAEYHSCDYNHCFGSCFSYYILTDPIWSELTSSFCESCYEAVQMGVSAEVIAGACTACGAAFVGIGIGCGTYCDYDTCGFCMDSTCGPTGWEGDAYCDGPNVYGTYRRYYCDSPDTLSSYCRSALQEYVLKDDCSAWGPLIASEWSGHYCENNSIYRARRMEARRCESGRCEPYYYERTELIEECQDPTPSCSGTRCLNYPPTAEAGQPQSVAVGETIGFSGSGSDPDNSIVRYQWDFDDNGTWDSDSANGNAQYVYSHEGRYDATLKVCDSGGQCNEDTITITVNCRKPIAVIDGRRTLTRGEEAEFNASRSTAMSPAQSIKTYLWEGPDLSLTEPRNRVIINDNPLLRISRDTYFVREMGQKTIKLSVKDNLGCWSDEANFPVEVVCSSRPVALAGSDITVYQYENIRLDASASQGQIALYKWAGDTTQPLPLYKETTASVSEIQGIYQPGTYPLTLTIVDNNGCESSDALTLVVKPNANTVSATWNPNDLYEGEESVFSIKVTNNSREDLRISSIDIYWWWTKPNIPAYIAETEHLNPDSEGWKTDRVPALGIKTIYQKTSNVSGVGSWRGEITIHTNQGDLPAESQTTIRSR